MSNLKATVALCLENIVFQKARSFHSMTKKAVNTQLPYTFAFVTL